LTLRGKENLVALYPAGGGQGLVLDTLRYESEIKDADDIYAGIGKGKSREDMMQMAAELIEKRTEAFDPEKFKNRYVDALRELIAGKVNKGQAVAVDENDTNEGAKVIDFMEALKKSVGVSKPSKSEPTVKAPSKSSIKKKAKG
jgi:DNA end-binding protein Ku